MTVFFVCFENNGISASAAPTSSTATKTIAITRGICTCSTGITCSSCNAILNTLFKSTCIDLKLIAPQFAPDKEKNTLALTVAEPKKIDAKDASCTEMWAIQATRKETGTQNVFYLKRIRSILKDGSQGNCTYIFSAEKDEGPCHLFTFTVCDGGYKKNYHPNFTTISLQYSGDIGTPPTMKRSETTSVLSAAATAHRAHGAAGAAAHHAAADIQEDEKGHLIPKAGIKLLNDDEIITATCTPCTCAPKSKEKLEICASCVNLFTALLNYTTPELLERKDPRIFLPPHCLFQYVSGSSQLTQTKDTLVETLTWCVADASGLPLTKLPLVYISKERFFADTLGKCIFTFSIHKGRGPSHVFTFEPTNDRSRWHKIYRFDMPKCCPW